MSQENLEIARRVMEWMSTRDAESLVAASDPGVEWHSIFAISEGGVYRGHDGIRRYVSDLADTWEFGSATIDEGLVAGDVAVLVGRMHYRGKGSGVESEMALGWTLEFREGKLVRFRAFKEPEEAFEAAGLRSCPDGPDRARPR